MGVATLLRSIAYDRSITVLASVLLIAGATAAQRGRTWGAALAFGAAAAFPVAWLIGIAPAWFVLVGLIGAAPFALASRALARFDRGATAILTTAAAAMGALGAIAWKEYAWSLFESFPVIRPSVEAQHGLALTAVLVSAVLAVRMGRGGDNEQARVRVGPQVRIADMARVDAAELAALDDDEGSKAAFEARRARR